MSQKNEKIYKLSEFYKIFGDATRLRILYALLENRSCVREISEKLQISQSAVSHQLKILRMYHFVKFEKTGQCVFYSITDKHIKGILEDGMEHIEEIINQF